MRKEEGADVFRDRRGVDMDLLCGVQGPGLMPSKAYPGDAGFDLAYEGEGAMTIYPGEVVDVPCNIKIELPEGTWGLIIGRSSSLRRGLLVSQSVIDNGWRGGIFALVRNMGEDPYHVQPGERLAQLIILPILPVVMVPVRELNPSERGEKGFGSSGR